ncbi:MAG TPA: hypothetical protein PK228_04975 [Saprospiraceae bacterium]|nr:hypothetical protein [Saprospiraceae bacterium]
MKNKVGIFSLSATLALLLYFILQPSCSGVEKPLITPTINNISADAISMAWEKVPGVDSVEIQWRNLRGEILGRMVTTGNEALIRPGLSGEKISVVLTPYSKGDAKAPYETYMRTLSMSSESSVAYFDSIGTVDIILFAATLAQPGTILANLCSLCPSTQTTEEYCDGNWFNTGSPTADQYYRITVNGSRSDGTPISTVFIIRTTPSGDVHYLVSGAAVPCITLAQASLTPAGRFVVYDDGAMAFEIHGTLKPSVATPVRGVLLRNLKNVERFTVEKLNPCQ